MWILKHSNELLELLKSKAISKVSSINTFDLSTLYTIPHEQWISRLSGLIKSTFTCTNGSRRYKYVVVNNTAYLLKMKVTPNKID